MITIASHVCCEDHTTIKTLKSEPIRSSRSSFQKTLRLPYSWIAIVLVLAIYDWKSSWKWINEWNPSLPTAHSCYIHGTDSGVCSTQTLDATWKRINMPYCAQFIKYPACLPKEQSIDPSIHFPEGRWKNYTVFTKDNWIRETGEHFIINRTHIENNRTLHRQNRNEFGDRGRVKRRFYKKGECKNAYRAYMCYINFPRCDMDLKLSLPTCRSSCENYFKACAYSKDLWRCGKAKYFDGKKPETPELDSNGNYVTTREYFPGQPFRENKYSKDGDEEAICTPAIKGDGVSWNASYNKFMILISIIVTILAVLNIT